ncbi:MAG: tetratricopeptide repeat protein, partial [Bacteroidales bacterium]
MRWKWYCICLMLLLWVGHVDATESPVIDSLQKKLEIASVNEKPVILNAIAEAYYKESKLEEAELYASDAIIAARKIGNFNEEARANKIKSACMLRMLRYNEAIDMAKKAIDLYLKNNNTRQAAETYNHIGQINKQRLDFDKALEAYQKALKLFEVAADSLGVASTYNLMGSLYLRQGLYPRAIEFYQKALAMRLRAKDTSAIAASYANLALVYRDQGNFSRALELLTVTQNLYEKVNNKAELANTFNLLGSIYFRKNDFQQAIAYFEKALALRRELNSKAEIAALLNNIGNVYKEMNNFPHAFEYLQQALQLRKEIGEPKAIALSLNALGSAYWKAKKYNEALSYYLESLKQSLESEERSEIALAYYNIGNIYFELSNYEKALKHYSEALIYSSGVDDYARMASIYQGMGNAYQQMKKYKEAIENYEKALEIRQKLGDKTQIAVALSSIASAYADMQKYNEALKYYQQALAIRQQLGDRVGESIVLNAMGNLYLNLNQKQQALSYFNQAMQKAEQTGYLFNVALCQRKIAEIYIENNQYDRALPLLQKSIEIGKKISNYELLRKGYFALYTYHSRLRQYKEALDNYLRYSQYNDSINISMTNKQLLDMQINFELAAQQSQLRRQETEIALLKKEKQFNELQRLKNRLIIAVLLIAVLLVLSLVILYYNRYQMKHKTASLLQEKLDIIEKMNQQLRDSEAELRMLNNTKDKFFSIMAYDIKNPLGGMITITDIVKNDFAKLSDQEKAELFETINKTAQHLYNLLENLLHWSRSQTGRIPYSPVTLNLQQIVEQNIELQRANIEKKNLMVINMIDPDQTIYADLEMTSLILRNLISNAVKFSYEGGKIIISATPREGMMEIVVQDEGIGMSKDTLSKLFRIDTQVITPGTHNEKGTGLGLILCKEFVTRHGGQIWVESEEG